MYKRAKYIVWLEMLILFLLCSVSIEKKLHIAITDSTNNQQAAKTGSYKDTPIINETKTTEKQEKEFIKWLDFKVTNEAMRSAYQLDLESFGKEVHLNWVDLLAYLGTKYGGDFKKYKEKDLTNLSQALLSKEETMESLTKDLKSYSYYRQAYGAVLDGWVGEYEIKTEAAEEDTSASVAQKSETDKSGTWVKKYGLKAYLPIAKGYEYADYDDFGVSRSYGYSRPHLGHDMMGQVGTPVVAVESGYVEAIGWNQYGGWRLGIRSFDKKRYYYYAHLRKNFPYHKLLKEGSIVQAGDVIGYLGRTGYSATENVNNIDTAHLHWGLQIIFDESQKEGNGEIWVDCYELTRFLYQNRCQTIKNQETKEYYRTEEFKDPIALEFRNKAS